jgi:SDR family mycofactocin-dependent oxidoreductase
MASPGASADPRVAVVTGAARGIGAATVRALTARGWSVVAVDREDDDPRLPYALGRSATPTDSPAATPADSPLAPTARVVPFAADVADAGALAGAVALAEERFGGLDAMIAAAGVIAGGAPHWEVAAEQERAVLETDLGGVLNAARAAVPALLRRPEPRSGRFVAVASTAAVRGLPMLAAYCAAKAGVAGFVRALAVELAGTGVTANAVAPGSTRTAMLDETARLYGIAAEQFARQQPLGRLLEPDEVALLIAWLAGPESSGATGGLFPVDGGLAL